MTSWTILGKGARIFIGWGARPTPVFPRTSTAPKTNKPNRLAEKDSFTECARLNRMKDYVIIVTSRENCVWHWVKRERRNKTKKYENVGKPTIEVGGRCQTTEERNTQRTTACASS